MLAIQIDLQNHKRVSTIISEIEWIVLHLTGWRDAIIGTRVQFLRGGE